ncbi:MAG TPA: ABC transporter permease [Blastocatellia bacterium]|nr:ABC transporter permease [Blastocatellia bacterium]
MGVLNRFYHRLKGVVYKDAIERDMDDEMRFHMRMRAQQYIDQGMTPDEARRKALRQFGNLGVIKERGRRVKGGGLMEEFLKDLRYGTRMLVKNIGFTSVAVITLALGIGANTAIFSVVNSVLLKRLPYKEPDRIVRPYWRWVQGETIAVTAAGYDFFRQATSFELTAAYAGSGGGFNLLGGTQPLRVTGQAISRDLLPVLGVNPALGRNFTNEEDARNGPCAAIISDGLWRSNFGGNPETLGKSVELNGQSCTIVGILPGGFQFDDKVDVYIPLRLQVNPSDNGHNTDMIARLKPGVTIEQAQQEMDSMLPQFRAQYPNQAGPNERGIHLYSLRDSLVGDVSKNLLLMFGAVVFVLLIACANVANLLLARATSRRGEMAVRIALGAGRGRLIRQLMTENLLLSMIGCALGIFLAYWLVPLLLAMSPDSLPRSAEVRLDGRAVLFAIGAALITSILFGVGPAIHSTRLDVSNTLKSASGRSSGNKLGASGRGLLMIAEVALSLVLLSGAALLIRSFMKLNGVDLGFDPRNLTAMQISLNSVKYRTTASVVDLERRINEQIAHIPGVVAVGTVPGLPMQAGLNNYVYPEGTDPQSGQSVESRAITTDYFEAIGIPLISGRMLSEEDAKSPQPVCVINQTLARRFWTNSNPIGAMLMVANKPVQIVGVVGDIREKSLGLSPFATFYRPINQVADSMTTASNKWFLTSWVIRTNGPIQLNPTLREIVRNTDPDLPIAGIYPLTDVISKSINTRRFLMILMSAFAALALVLTSIGLFGVISYQVSQRTQEIGIRMALGASAARILKLIVGQGMILTLVGLVIGLLASYWLTQLMTDMLFEVTAKDPMTFAVISLLLIAVSMMACLIPARRAMKVDPMIALRYE